MSAVVNMRGETVEAPKPLTNIERTEQLLEGISIALHALKNIALEDPNIIRNVRAKDRRGYEFPAGVHLSEMERNIGSLRSILDMRRR